MTGSGTTAEINASQNRTPIAGLAILIYDWDMGTSSEIPGIDCNARHIQSLRDAKSNRLAFSGGMACNDILIKVNWLEELPSDG